MIYLIFDTNIWLYLANGLCIDETNKFYDKEHFCFLNKLKTLKKDNDVVILTNEIILKEWERNKSTAYLNIKKLKNKLNNNNHLSDYQKYSSDSKQNIDVMNRNYRKGINELIDLNKQHILNVEYFLRNECEIVKITSEMKVKIFEMSISKYAPFHNNKNNIADAAILFSSLAYLNEKPWITETVSFFVSNNFVEYTDSENQKKFHPGILKQIEENYPEVGIEYHRILPKALEFGKNVLQEMQMFYAKELEHSRGDKLY